MARYRPAAAPGRPGPGAGSAGATRNGFTMWKTRGGRRRFAGGGRRDRRLHLELPHHVEVLVRAVVAVEDEAAVEVPELVVNGDRLVGPEPDHVLPALELAGAWRPPLDLADPEAPEVDVDRVPPPAGGVVEHPPLGAVQGRLRIGAQRIEDLPVDRPVGAVALAELEVPDPCRLLHVGLVLARPWVGRLEVGSQD